MKGYRPQHKKAVPKQKKRGGLLLAAVVLTTAALITGLTMAKYVQQWKSEPALADAKAFYFTSDLLKDVDENASYTIDTQTTSFTFTLGNAADSQRVTGESITYNVQVTGGTVDHASGSLPGGTAQNAKITVTPAAGVNEITVSATSGAPYAKTLTAKFLLAPGSRYMVEDQSGNTAAVLTIVCTGSEKEILLTLPQGVVPDATDARVTKTENGFRFQPPGPGAYSLVLLKADANLNLHEAETAFADTIVIKSA